MSHIFDSSVYTEKASPVAADLLALGDSASLTDGIPDNRTINLTDLANWLSSTGFTNLGTGTGGLRLGSGAGAANTTGCGNVCIGKNAGAGLTTGGGNCVISATPFDTPGSYNLGSATKTSQSVVIGTSVLNAATAGSTINASVAIGTVVLTAMTSGTFNTSVAIGIASFWTLTTGSVTNSIGIGSAFENVTTGTVTTSVGIGSGSANTMTSGDHCTFLGSGADTGFAASSYRAAIGAGSVNSFGDNSIVLGRQRATDSPQDTVVFGAAATMAGVAGSFTATAPAQTAAAQAGVGITLTASNAVDGSSGHLAANGGSINLNPGTAVNSGSVGAVVVASASPLTFSTDTGLARNAAGVIELNNGTKGVTSAGVGITIPPSGERRRQHVHDHGECGGEWEQWEWWELSIYSRCIGRERS